MNRLPNSLAAVPASGKEEIPPSELWLALTQLPRPHRVVPFPRCLPGTDIPVGELAIWPLSQEEQMAANAEADRFTKQLLKDPQRKEEANLGYHHTYTNEVAIQVLWRSCRNVNDLQRPAFPSPKLMRAAFSTDEVGVLFNNYLTVQGEVGPIISHMSKGEVEGMILRLQAGGSAVPFDSLSWEEQRSLVSSMASQLVSCWMAMFSAGLPLDVSTYVKDQLPSLLQQFSASQAAQESGSDPETEPSEDPPSLDPASLEPEPSPSE